MDILRSSTRWRSVFLAGVLALLAVTAGYGQKATLVKGRLLNGSSPVPDALVVLALGVTRGPQTITDANGNFAFQLALNGSVSVKVSTVANLFNPGEATALVHPGDVTEIVPISVSPKGSGQIGSVQGSVITTGGVPVPGAQVSVRGAGATLTATTDSLGNFTFPSVGFNTNLALLATTGAAPCIVPARVPLNVNSSNITATITAARVLSLRSGCPVSAVSPKPQGSEPQPLIAVDSSVVWAQADSQSIQTSADLNAWNTGRVNDLLRFAPGNGFLAATDDGGVWQVNEDPGRTANALSNSWPGVSISSLAAGTGGPADSYAGTDNDGISPGGQLWETDTSTSSPLMNWAPVNSQPGCAPGPIAKILVIPEARYIVLACNTGLWWSSIPAAPSVKGTYTWKQAQPTSLGNLAFSGLAKGPGWSPAGTNGTIAATRWAGHDGDLFYTGTWSNGQLVLTSSPVPVSGQFSRTSVASCSGNPNTMFAVLSDGAGQTLAAVLQSLNGGTTWVPVDPPPNAGIQGDSNQAVAISSDCGTVALGWQTGTFVSFFGGAPWTQLVDTGEYNNLHTDVHALVFDPAVPGALFIASSGGVASATGVISGLTPAFESDWNEHLFNLEFFQGTSSFASPGTFAGAAQDNAVLTASLPGPWTHALDCPGILECSGQLALIAPADGLTADLLPDDEYLLDGNLMPPTEDGAQLVQPFGVPFPFFDQTPVPILGCAASCGYRVLLAVPVRFPVSFGATGQFNSCAVTDTTSNESECLLAVGSLAVENGTQSGIYGLFTTNPDIYWRLLSGGPNLWSNVSAIGPAYDASAIFIGNTAGQLFELDLPQLVTDSSAVGPPKNLSLELPSACTSPCPVAGIYTFTSSLAFATVGPNVMKWDGIQWRTVNGTPPDNLPDSESLLSITAADQAHVYVASSTEVFDTTNGGSNWKLASTGLPAVIPGAPGFQQDGALGSHDYLQISTGQPAVGTGGSLGLASFGRSLWTTLSGVPTPLSLKQYSGAHVEIVTGNDNAESRSELQIQFFDPSTETFGTFCLKASSEVVPSPGNICANGTGVEWANGSVHSEAFSFSPRALDFTEVTITLFQHNGLLQGSDNWDLQDIHINGLATDGSIIPLLAPVTPPYQSGVNNCIARLRDVPNPNFVTYDLSAEDPQGFEITHPNAPLRINFGPTPPGSCPQ